MTTPRRVLRAILVAVSVLLKAALLLPLPVFVIKTNLEAKEQAEINAALAVNQYERDSAKALLGGQTLDDYDHLLNERLVMRLLTENLEQPFDTIALGSSRILQLTQPLADGGNFFNCGMSGADYRDVMNMFYLFDKAGMLPKNVVIGLDPWLLNGDENMLHGSSDAELFKEFITLRLGYSTDYTPPEPEPEPSKAELYWQMLDLGLFKQNYGQAQDPLPAGTPPPVFTGSTQANKNQLKLSDGSVLYPAAFRSRTAAEVELSARVEATTFLRMGDYEAPYPWLCELFTKFVQYMQGRGVNVILVCVPYHPIVYNYAMENADVYPGFFLTEPWFRSFAKQQGIALYGTYNPFLAGCGFEDFYDGLHIRGQALQRIFPGVQTALRQGAGATASLGEMTVAYDMAERLVVSRYEIAPPHEVRRGDDLVIGGQNCYRVDRYESDSEKAILLASYAVAESDGMLYRLDTLLNAWVVDKRIFAEGEDPEIVVQQA